MTLVHIGVDGNPVHDLIDDLDFTPYRTATCKECLQVRVRGDGREVPERVEGADDEEAMTPLWQLTRKAVE